MLSHISAALDKSRQHLDEIIEKLDNHCAELSEDTINLWRQAKPKLESLKDSLESAQKSLHAQTEEVLLQAHLATMDAYDQWVCLSQTIAGLARYTQRNGLAELQHTVLQAQLAKMETRDFMSAQGEVIKKNFQYAREKLEESSHGAANEMAKKYREHR
jgi:exonuclease VII small subunit